MYELNYSTGRDTGTLANIGQGRKPLKRDQSCFYIEQNTTYKAIIQNIYVKALRFRSLNLKT